MTDPSCLEFLQWATIAQRLVACRVGIAMPTLLWSIHLKPLYVEF